MTSRLIILAAGFLFNINLIIGQGNTDPAKPEAIEIETLADLDGQFKKYLEKR
jgi:hypothetical protein